MMNPIYRFFVNGVQMTPNYNTNVTKDYELERGQRFYREKLSGKFTFQGRDYHFLNAQPFETDFIFVCEISYDNGQTWSNYSNGIFHKTDCTWNSDNQTCIVQPEPRDQYNDVLAGIEMEYDLVRLNIPLNRLNLLKRPLIQIYSSGDSSITNYTGGTWWEQDCDSVNIRTELEDIYKFGFTDYIVEMEVLAYDAFNNAIDGIYSGHISIDIENYGYVFNRFSGSLTSLENPTYRIDYSLAAYPHTSPPSIAYTIELRRNSDNAIMYALTSSDFNKTMFDYYSKSVPGVSMSGFAYISVRPWGIFSRYLLDVSFNETLLTTYSYPRNDLVGNNLNYRYVMPVGHYVGMTNQENSISPTRWGIRTDGKYYTRPNLALQTFPIARSQWGITSIWFNMNFGPGNVIYDEGRIQFALRDNYMVSDVIKVLLQQFAPTIQHEATPEYSEFFYSNSNPLSGQNFRLLITQKSNILHSNYDMPAQRAPTTLQSVMNMLRDCYQCYWYIDNNKFKIEHISWFKRGGSYTGDGPTIDVTSMTNVRNSKKWSYATNEWTFDKMEIPDRLEFNWMDEASNPFVGFPIEILSRYAMPGKIEKINLSQFTTDVDFMLASPQSINQDGFGLFSASWTTKDNITGWWLPIVQRQIDGTLVNMQNGYLSWILLHESYWKYNLPASRVRINDYDTIAYGVDRKKKHNISLPAITDPDPMQLVITELGIGQCDKYSINLHSRNNKATIKYDTE